MSFFIGVREIFTRIKKVNNLDTEVSSHIHVYAPNENIIRRSISSYNELVNNLRGGNSIAGVKKYTILSKISYIDMYDLNHPDPMHFFCTGLMFRIIDMLIDDKDKYYHINNKNLNILDNRINKFKINSNFKRSLNKLRDYNNWKSGDFFEYTFYLAPVIFKSIINQDVYNHLCLLIYIVSKLWVGNLDAIAIDKLKQLIKKYMLNVQIIFDNQEYTINNHQMEHIITSFIKCGPLSINNAFAFEAKNLILKKMVHSPVGMLEQIAQKFLLSLFGALIKDKQSFEPKLYGKKYRIDEKECFSKYSNSNGQVFTTNNCTNKLKDYFVECIDGSFIEVTGFYKENDISYFVGNEIKIERKFSFRFDKELLEFDHILYSKLTNNVKKFKTTYLKEKVVFTNRYKSNTDELLDDKRLGFVIKQNHILHN